MNTTENSNLPVNIREFTSVIQTAPDVLRRNETSVSACNSAGQALIDTIESCGGITSDELDADVAKFIDKVKLTVKNMNDRRKPVTQLLTAISKQFTTLEAEIDLKSADSIPAKLQKCRDQYAAKKIAEQKAREEAARRTQAIENEKASYRADLSVLLGQAYSAYVGKHISYMQSLYDRATLDNYSDKFNEIKNMSTVFSWTDFAGTVKDGIVTYYLGEDERKNIKREVSALKRSEYAESYAFEIEEMKDSVIERMPSKRKALEEEYILRQQDAEAAARAEKERKAREAEAVRKAEEESKRRGSEAKARAESEKQAAEAQAAFNFMNEAAPTSQISAKVKKKIVVNNPRGFVEIYQMWITKEGFNLSIPELEKIHKKMITFCEKEANRDGGETIKSAFIQYVDDVKAK
jgi:hypothetical protein